MALVETTTSRTLEPFGTPGRENMPAGWWFAEHVGTGDGSGGAYTGRIQINDAKFVWSFEDLSWEAPSSMQCEYQVGLPLAHNGSVVFAGWRRTATAYTYPVDTSRLHTFGLGVPWRITNKQPIAYGLIQVYFPTNTNSAIYLVMAWGYYWDASVLRDGIPLKPGW